MPKIKSSGHVDKSSVFCLPNNSCPMWIVYDFVHLFTWHKHQKMYDQLVDPWPRVLQTLPKMVGEYVPFHSLLAGKWIGWLSLIVQLPEADKDDTGSGKMESINTGWWFGTFFIFPCIGNNHPNWLIFFRGVETTNQKFVWLLSDAFLFSITLIRHL